MNFPCPAIEYVTHHSVSQGRPVYAILVGSSRLDLYLEKTELAKAAIEPPHHPIMRDRLSPSRDPRRHSDSPHRIAADAFRDRPPFRLQPPMDQRNVSLLHLATGELCSQLPMRFIVLCHHDQTAGLFVQ